MIVKKGELDGIEKGKVGFELRAKAFKPRIVRMGSDDEAQASLDFGKLLERFNLGQEASRRVEDKNVFPGEGELCARDEEEAAGGRSFLEVGGVGDNVMVGNGQGVEPQLGCAVDEPFGAKINVVLGVLGAVRMQIHLEMGSDHAIYFKINKIDIFEAVFFALKRHF